MNLYWCIQWLVYHFCVFLPFVAWISYEVLCCYDVFNAFNNHAGDLAKRVVRRGHLAHFCLCFVLGMWHLIVPAMLTALMAPTKVGWCLGAACVSWAMHSIAIWCNAGVLTMMLQWLEHEMCCYYNFLKNIPRRNVVTNIRLYQVMLTTPRHLMHALWIAIKSVCFAPMHLFRKYSTIVEDIVVARNMIAREQSRGNPRADEMRTLVHTQQELENVETTLYTFPFVLVTAVPMRVLLVIAFRSVLLLCSWVASCVYYFVWTKPTYEQTRALVEKTKRFLESLEQAK